MADDSKVTDDLGRFAIVPLWLIESGVSSGAVHLYALLAAKWANHTTGECTPSRATIATLLDKSKRTVDNYIRELRDVGALTVQARVTAYGDQTSNQYHLRHIAPDRAETAPPGETDFPTPPGNELPHPQQPVATKPESVKPESETEPENQENTGASPAAPPLALVSPPDPPADPFDDWYRRYPRKVARPRAATAYKAARKRATIDDLNTGLDRWNRHWQQAATPTEYIPHPATWLNGDRWLDDIPDPQPAFTSVADRARAKAEAREAAARKASADYIALFADQPAPHPAAFTAIETTATEAQ